MQPGSSRDLRALFSIIFMNSPMRSSLISASTMTENGFDMLRAVFENDFVARQDALEEAREEALVLKAEDDRSRRRQEEAKIFMASSVCCYVDCASWVFSFHVQKISKLGINDENKQELSS